MRSTPKVTDTKSRNVSQIDTLRLNFYYLKIIPLFVHVIIRKAKNKCVDIHEIIQLIILKLKTKMKNRSRRCDITDQDLDMDKNIVNMKSVSV